MTTQDDTCVPAPGSVQPTLARAQQAVAPVRSAEAVAPVRSAEAVAPAWCAAVVAQANDVVLVTEAGPLDAASGGPRVVHVNPAFTRMTGYDAQDILGRTPRMLQSPRTDRAELDRVHTALARWEPVEVELLNVRKDGTEFWVQLTITPVADEQGRCTHWLAIQRDVTVRRTRELALAAALASTVELVLLLDNTGTVVDASPCAREQLGTAPDGLLGTSILDLAHTADQELMSALLAPVEVLRTGRPAVAELRWRHRSGGWRWLAVSVSDGDPPGGLVVVCTDITERRANQDELHHRALHDGLTGLANRALLLDRLTRSLHPGAGPTAVLFCDLDCFKGINDAWGHPAGDHVLTTIATRLQSAVRPGDTVARLHGDEFVVLCPNTTLKAATATAARLHTVLGAPIPVAGDSIVVSASIGIVVSTPTCTAESLLAGADTAMYSAKATGPGRTHHRTA